VPVSVNLKQWNFNAMTQRPIPDDLLPWVLKSLPEQPRDQGELVLVAGDASPRRYFRLQLEGRSLIVAEAPPATEKNQAFVAVQTLLAQGGVRVPDILAVDFERGYLVLEDLGARTLLPLLNHKTADGYYQAAFAVLNKIAAIDISGCDFGCYDSELLNEELSRFPEWFVERLLGSHLNKAASDMLQRFNARLVQSALEQPRVLVHRDFHSRNIMVLKSEALAVIDFQDAVVGPITYDLASLLRDCYIRWPADRVTSWVAERYQQLQHNGQLSGVSESQYRQWFDWMGLQRHIKVLGTFARLSLRDGKPGYLADLPLVIAYVEQTAQQYASQEPVFAEFLQWFESDMLPLITRQQWWTKR
jgi:aminoglycoside/choline kinase family phosphotransferase